MADAHHGMSNAAGDNFVGNTSQTQTNYDFEGRLAGIGQDTASTRSVEKSRIKQQKALLSRIAFTPRLVFGRSPDITPFMTADSDP